MGLLREALAKPVLKIENIKDLLKRLITLLLMSTKDFLKIKKESVQSAKAELVVQGQVGYLLTTVIIAAKFVVFFAHRVIMA